MTEELTVPAPGFKDRTALLVIFGVFAILLGMLSGGMALLMIAAQLFAKMAGDQGSPGAQGMAMAIFLYGALAVALVWLGIGSIQAKRWARALLLTCSSLALAIGTCGFVMMLVILPHLNSITPPDGSQMPQGFMAAMMGVMMVVVFFAYIVIPGAFVLAYRSRHVKATCCLLYTSPSPRD